MIEDTVIALREELGEAAVRIGGECAQRRYFDWSGSPAQVPIAVVAPSDPSSIARALAICNRTGQRVCVQGGLTGLVGGANPQSGEIVLSLEKLNRIEEVDEMAGTAIVQAGVTLQALQERVADFGWSFPVDFGARGSCQLGGNAATNAGGLHVLRHGMMRDAVLGLEVALPDGTLLTMLDRVLKNNAGFDLKHLFIGSEGTLGVITRLTVRLMPSTMAGCTALCALPSFNAATLLLRKARQLQVPLLAFELMWHPFLAAAAQVIGRSLPFDTEYPVYALIETSGSDEDASERAITRLLEIVFADGIVSDAILAQSRQQSRDLWAFRESIPELLTALKPSVNFDVSIQSSRMSAFIERIAETLKERYADRQHLLFGHLGDGNLHLMSGPYPEAQDIDVVEEIVYRAVAAQGGSISAEHGIGVKKRQYLHYSRSSSEIGLMRLIKSAIDPKGILNPGRVID